jgi:hypothetical protein
MHVMARVIVPPDVASEAKKPARAREPRVLVLEVDASISELPREQYPHESPDVSSHLPRLTQLRAMVRASGSEAVEAVRTWAKEKHPSASLTVRSAIAYVLADRAASDEISLLACQRLDPPPAVALVLADASDLAAMADTHHQDHQCAALPFVDHAVVTHPQAPQPFEFTLERRACSRGVTEQVDGLNHPQAFGLWECGECLGSRALNLQRAVHLAPQPS